MQILERFIVKWKAGSFNNVLSNNNNRGDVIRAMSDPIHVDNIWVDGIVNGTRTTYGREVELLEDLGYKFDSSKFEFVK